LASSLVTPNEDAQVSKIVTVFETPEAAPLSQKKTRKASPVSGKSGRVAPFTNNPDVDCAGTEDIADMKRNAIITPEHSQVLTPKLFQSIFLTTRKFLTKARKVSLKSLAVVLKTNVFSVKQPSNRDDKRVARSSGERNEQNPVHKSLNKAIKSLRFFSPTNALFY